MNDRRLPLAAGLAALAVALAAPGATMSVTAQAQSSRQSWKPPLTADGRPDFQGVWVNNNAAPLERPTALAGRAALTDQELAAMKRKARELFSGDGDAAFGDSVFNSVLANIIGAQSGYTSTDGETGDYGSAWTVERDWDHRTSLITDPPDGRLPPMTPDGLTRRAASAAALNGVPAGPEDRLLQERCITYGSPSMVAGYASAYEIVQAPDTVTLTVEMIHDTRVIPVDAAAHLPSTFKRWHGDSRGHWEGDSLVVDTVNYKAGAFMRVSSERLHVVERFSRTEPDVLKYDLRIEDPDTWTKPWSFTILLRRANHPMYEYACHEGNRGLEGILAGARAQERAAGLPKR
jgi:hypothetical protein